VTLNNLGRTLTAAKQYDEAAVIFKKCLAGVATTLKPDDYRQGLFTGNYGRCLMGQGQWPEAEAQLREAVRILTKAFGVSDPRVRQNLTSLAEVCDHLNRADEAASIRKQLAETAPPTP
jgi:tetratricopeptide (TPR) repeat protein